MMEEWEERIANGTHRLSDLYARRDWRDWREQEHLAKYGKEEPKCEPSPQE